MSRRDREAAAWFARMRGPDAADHGKAFEAWRADPENAAAYADAESDWLMAACVPRARVAADDETRAARRSAPMRWAPATVAAAAIALGFAWHVWPGEQVPRLAEQTVSEGDLQLPDGSTVWLAGGARADVRYAPSERRILLYGGRARFAVAHDAARPFVVEAAGSETVALGTEFEVDLSQGPVLVRLIKGSVEVRATGTASKVRLAPGERAAVENRVARIVPAIGRAIATSIIDADDLPLATIIDRANRVNKTPIGLADPALGALRLTGRFDISDSAGLARKLAAAHNLAVETTADEIIMRAKAKKAGE